MVEVYKEGTTNHFLTGYVAIVNAQEIPIGGIKVVGVFEPGSQRHESPLSQWFFDLGMKHLQIGDLVKAFDCLVGIKRIDPESFLAQRLEDDIERANEQQRPRE